MRADHSRENLFEDRGGGSYNRLGGVAVSSQTSEPRARSALAERLDRYFSVSARGSTVTTEVRSGCIAWMTMSYIMVVNPVILGRAGSSSDPLPPEAVMSATAFSAAFGSLAVGLLGDAPLGLMPGMGLNAYFAFGICHTFKVSWQEALSCCLVSGALLVAFAVLGVCQYIVTTVLSDHLKKAITVAIGVFQALIGFQVMGLVVASPDTLVTLGDISMSNERLYLALAGFCMISAMLVMELHGAILIGIWAMAVCAWLTGLQAPPDGVLALPRFDAFFCVDFSGWHPASGKLPGMICGSLVMMFVALFDLAGVQYGLMGIAGLVKNGVVPRSTSIFASAGLATMLGALAGTSPVIIANESSAGIVEGAKTGLMAVVVAVLFVFSAFMGPLLAAVPHVATAVPLVLIGAFMMSPCRGIDWDNLRAAIPSFLTLTVVPFTYSIHTGIIAGILMDAFLALSATATTDHAPPVLPSPHSTASGAVPQAVPIDNRLPMRSPPAVVRRISTPHMTRAASHRDPKAEAARQLLLLYETEIPTSGGPVRSEAEAARDEGLRRALEAYVDSH